MCHWEATRGTKEDGPQLLHTSFSWQRLSGNATLIGDVVSKPSATLTTWVNGNTEKRSHPSDHLLGVGPYVSQFNANLWACCPWPMQGAGTVHWAGVRRGELLQGRGGGSGGTGSLLALGSFNFYPSNMGMFSKEE